MKGLRPNSRVRELGNDIPSEQVFDNMNPRESMVSVDDKPSDKRPIKLAPAGFAGNVTKSVGNKIKGLRPSKGTSDEKKLNRVK